MRDIIFAPFTGKLLRFLFISLLVTSLSPLCAHADDPQLIGVYKNWNAYRAKEDGGVVCYALSKRLAPKTKDKIFKHRGQVMLQVTNRPADNSRNVISYVAGHSLKAADGVTLFIDKQKFSLKASGDSAWAKDSADDAAVTKAIRGGHSMYVTHAYKKQTITDMFSPAGASAAIDAIGNCK